MKTEETEKQIFVVLLGRVERKGGVRHHHHHPLAKLFQLFICFADVLRLVNHHYCRSKITAFLSFVVTSYQRFSGSYFQ